MAINDLSLNASPLMPFSTTAESSPRPNNLDAAAQEFEALFLQQVLKQMRKATDALSSELSFKSNTLSTYQEFYDQALAQKLAQGKQTGLADLIVKQLSPANSNPSAVSQSVSADQHFTANATSNTQATPFNGTRSLFTEPARESLRVADDNAFLQLYRNAPTSSALSQPLTRLGEKLANELSLMGNRFGEALSKSDFYQLVKRVIKQESSGRIDAVSPKGALGLMQLMPSTAREMAQEQGLNYSSERLLKDPHYNMRLGTAYLQKMLKRYDHSTPLALAAYNAGPGRVDEWLSTIGDPRTGEISEANWVNRIPLSETRHYTQSILGEFNPRNGRVAFK